MFSVFNGAKPYEVGKGNPPQTKEIQKNKIYNGYEKKDDSWIPYMRGKRIHRFTTMWDGEYIKYGENLAAPRDPKIFFREKVFVRQTGDSIIATLDNGNVSNDTLHIVFSDDKSLDNRYLLGLLNSILMSWFYQSVHPTEVGKPMAQVKKNFIEELPIVVGSDIQQTKIIEITDSLLTECQKRHEIRRKFVKYIAKIYEPKSISEKLENFDALTYKEFCSELKKQKVKLSSSEQMDLLTLFEATVEQVKEVSVKIKSLYLQLNTLVFEIYGIEENLAQKMMTEFLVDI